MHRPSPEHLRRLDQLYGARGELLKLAEGSPGRIEPARHLYVTDIFRDVADALIERLVKDEHGRPLGWSRNLAASSPGTLNTAYVIRTLQLLDDGRVDLHSLADILDQDRHPDGWGYRIEEHARPEVTAVVLTALARLGRLTDVDNDLNQLKALVDDFARSRPFVLAVALEGALAIRPESTVAHDLTRYLLNSRTPHGDRMLWTMTTSAPSGRTTPSLAHTARATAVLRLAQPNTPHQTEVDEAVKMATEWMISLHKSDTGAIELLEGSETRPAIPIHHFTAAWVIRALASVKDVPATRLNAALDVLWGSYSPTDRLWIWRDEGSLPSWMTLDAVSALRVHAEASLLSPFSTGTGGDIS